MQRLLKRYLFFVLVLMGTGIAFWYLLYQPNNNTAKPTFQEVLAHKKKNIVPVLILGSGPAGLSAALYTARAKVPTIVLAGPLPGGQLSWVRQIENWPAKKRESGQEIIKELEQQAKRFGAIILQNTATKINLKNWPFSVFTESQETLNALSLIIATGRIPKRLHIPGVNSYWGHGVGVCTICDAPFHKNQIVGVVGGGDTAVDHALQLAAYAKKVYMFVRDNDLDAMETAQEYVKTNPKISIMYNVELKKIKGDGKNVQALTIENNKTKIKSDIEAQGVYFAIGWHPNSEIVRPSIYTDSKGFIKVDCLTQQTNICGIFAAGDVIDPLYGKAGVATGSGIKAGMDAIEYLQNIGADPQTLKGHAQDLYQPKSVGNSIIELNSKAMLDQFIKENPDTLILLEFSAKYCPACKALLPILGDIQKNFSPKMRAAKVDIEQAPDLVKEFEANSIPYLVILKNGKMITSSTTARSKNDIINLLLKIDK